MNKIVFQGLKEYCLRVSSESFMEKFEKDVKNNLDNTFECKFLLFILFFCNVKILKR